ncbi:MAG: hypothetical protein AAFO61_07800 [Pseudomonadota bacterium]
MRAFLTFVLIAWAAPAFAQNTTTTQSPEQKPQETLEKPKELTQEEKDRALLLSNLLGGWVRLGPNGSPFSNENALAAANKCVAGSQNTGAPASGDVLYFTNGTTLQRLEPGTGSTVVIQQTRVVRSSGSNKLWALTTGANTGKLVTFRKTNSRAGDLTLMLEDNIIYLGCVSLMRLRQ